MNLMGFSQICDCFKGLRRVGKPIFLSLCTLPSSSKSERHVLSEHVVRVGGLTQWERFCTWKNQVITWRHPGKSGEPLPSRGKSVYSTPRLRVESRG